MYDASAVLMVLDEEALALDVDGADVTGTTSPQPPPLRSTERVSGRSEDRNGGTHCEMMILPLFVQTSFAEPKPSSK